MDKPYFAVQWHIMDTCDQRCIHCYIYSEENLCFHAATRPELERTLQEILSFCDGIGRRPYIYLTGGDPILHPDFWYLLDLFRRNSVRFCIMGNPFHLNLEICREMRTAGCVKYQLSVDGLENTHDFFRKPGSFRETLEKTAVIRKSGMWCAWMTTVSKLNMREIPQVIDLAAANHVDVYAIGRYCPTSMEKAYDPETHMTPQEYRDFLESCWEAYERNRGSGTTFQLKDHLWTLFLYEKGIYRMPQDNRNTGCNCGRNHITILPDGDVYACRRMDSKIGNLKEHSLEDLWNSEQLNYYRRTECMEKCAACPLKNVCRGCPAVTYGYTHNFYGADPQCWKIV